MKDRKFLALSVSFFLLFAVAMMVVAFEKPATTIIKATTANPSPHKSFAIVYPQTGIAGEEGGAKAGTKIRVSLYIRDPNGVGLKNRSVKLSAAPSGVSIAPSDEQVTNEIGMAEFFVSTKTPGKVVLTAVDIASKMEIPNIPPLEFTN